MLVDLKNAIIEIKTDSELGSDDQLRLLFYTSNGFSAGGFHAFFGSIPQYYLPDCYSSRTIFPSNLPVARVKIWRITLTKTSGIRLQIHCNNVEVLNILLSDTRCSKKGWSTYWKRDVGVVDFDTGALDTASVCYKLSFSGNSSSDSNEINLIFFIYISYDTLALKPVPAQTPEYTSSIR